MSASSRPIKGDKRWVVGAVVYAKASTVMKSGDLGRRFGSLQKDMWLPGVVTKCLVKQSDNQRVRYMFCDWYVGGADIKTGKEVAMSSTKIDLPIGMKLPLGTPYSPPEPVLATQAPLAETQPTAEATSTAVTTSEELETVSAAASATNIDCHGVSWIKDDTATHTDVNGSTQPRNWHMRVVIGNMHCTGSDPNSNFSRKDYFLMALPVAAINHFIACTSH